MEFLLFTREYPADVFGTMASFSILAINKATFFLRKKVHSMRWLSENGFLSSNLSPIPKPSPLTSLHVLGLSAVVLLVGSILLAFRSRIGYPKHSKQFDTINLSNLSRVQDLRRLDLQDETASVLLDLFDKDGAGAWPPKANHSSWPSALRPYSEIYHQMAPFLSAADTSLGDNVNSHRRETFRAKMRKLLSERINVKAVERILREVETTDDRSNFPRDCYNGFYCCVAVCRHAYR